MRSKKCKSDVHNLSAYKELEELSEMSLFSINQDSGQIENVVIMLGEETAPLPTDAESFDELYYSIKKRVYLAARDGFELLIPSLLNTIPSEEVRNVLVNQVGAQIFPE